jgi:penicillin amidase
VGSIDGSGSNEVLALAWPALREDDVTVESGFDLAVAHNAEEARQALRHLAAPEQNVGFADRFGHIGFLAAGLVPIRKKGDGRLPVPGWTGEYDWTGFIPFDRLPQAMDPPSGLFVNANNRVVGPDYPYTIAVDWPPGLRARRLQALLGDATGVTLDRARAVQLDIVSTLAQDFLPFLLTVTPADTEERDILDGLRRWDRTTAAGRWEPLVFTAWYEALAPRIYADELGPLFFAYRGMRPDFLHRVLTRRQVWCDDVATPAIESCPEQVALAFHDALAMLRGLYGNDWEHWSWGAAHPAVMAHRPFHEVRRLRRLFDIVRPVGGDPEADDAPRRVRLRAHGPRWHGVEL